MDSVLYLGVSDLVHLTTRRVLNISLFPRWWFTRSYCDGCGVWNLREQTQGLPSTAFRVSNVTAAFEQGWMVKCPKCGLNHLVVDDHGIVATIREVQEYDLSRARERRRELGSVVRQSLPVPVMGI